VPNVLEEPHLGHLECHLPSMPESHSAMLQLTGHTVRGKRTSGLGSQDKQKEQGPLPMELGSKQEEEQAFPFTRQAERAHLSGPVPVWVLLRSGHSPNPLSRVYPIPWTYSSLRPMDVT
jgi:hypothetical protein